MWNRDLAEGELIASWTGEFLCSIFAWQSRRFITLGGILLALSFCQDSLVLTVYVFISKSAVKHVLNLCDRIPILIF